jgi:hypothetical protein
MILQEGRYYWSRDGRINGPLIRLNDPPNPAFPFYNQSLMDSWAPDGRSLTCGKLSDFDLVKEITCPVVDPFHAVASPDATPKVDRVVLASKILPRLAPDLVPSMAARQALQYADAFLKEIEND